MASNLTKMTVNLVPRAVAALEVASILTKDNKTDVVNRALQVYAYLEQKRASGKKLIIVDDNDGSVEAFLVL